MLCHNGTIRRSVSRVTRLFETGVHLLDVMRSLTAISVLVVLASLGQTLSAQRIYSYVDDKGVKVFTNLGGRRSAAPRIDVPKARPAKKLSRRANRFDDLIGEIAQRHGEDENLVKAIIQVESAFDPNAVSVKNCQGLMQLHPDTAKRFGVSDSFDPAQNIEGGVKYLRWLRNDFDDLKLVLAAYNAGENAVHRHKGIPPYKETERYVEKVLAIYTPPSEDPSPRGHSIYRVVLPDGSVLITNRPPREASR